MIWIPVAVASYFLNALAAVIDKFLLEKRIPEPLVYVFYTGILSIGVVIFILPFGVVTFIPIFAFSMAILTGALFLVALYFFYIALRYNDASRVVPLIGGASPLFIIAISYAILGELITRAEFVAVAFFIGGGFLLAYEHNERRGHLNTSLIALSLSSAFFFAVTFFLTKEVFKLVEFWPGFFWMRMGSFFAALLFLPIPALYRKLRMTTSTASSNSLGLFVINKIIGALGFLLLNYAIFLPGTNVSVINAMKGLEHFFVFGMTALVAVYAPHILRESFDKRSLVTKLSGTLILAFGFIFLFV